MCAAAGGARPSGHRGNHRGSSVAGRHLHRRRVFALGRDRKRLECPPRIAHLRDPAGSRRTGPDDGGTGRRTRRSPGATHVDIAIHHYGGRIPRIHDTFGGPDVVACALDVLGRPRFSCTSFIGERHRRLGRRQQPANLGAQSSGHCDRRDHRGVVDTARRRFRRSHSSGRPPCRSCCRARQPAVDGRRGRGPGGFQR